MSPPSGRFDYVSLMAKSRRTPVLLEDPIWAAGTFVSSEYDVFEQYDGTSWTAVTISDLYAGHDLWISSSGTDGWMVGEPTDTDYDKPLWRWDGSSWTRQTTTLTHEDYFPYSFYSIADDDIWLSSQRGSLFHWNGTSWTDYSDDLNRTYTTYGATTNDVWGTGAAVIRHWDGLTWSDHTTIGTYDWAVIHGSSASNVWAVDRYGNVTHWDGLTWSTPESIAGISTRSIWVFSDTDVWVGAAQEVSGKATYTRMRHWDGTSWVTYDVTHLLQWGITKIVGLSTDNVYAIGQDNIIHWDGVYWEAVSDRATFRGERAMWVNPSSP